MNWLRRALPCLLLPLALAAAEPAGAPARIVSINLLTDQWLLVLAPRERIASVTFLAHDPAYSPRWREAREFPANRGAAEEVLRFAPDLVLAGRYAAAEAVGLLRRLGVRVVVLDYAQDFAGIAAQAREIAGLVGDRAAGERFAAGLESRLARVRAHRPATPLRVLDYGQHGWTHGSGTVLDLVIREAGHRNVAAERGVSWMAQVPLEELLRLAPDALLVPDRLGSAPALADGVFSHAAFRRLAARARPISLPAGTTDFGGPFTIDALEYLAAALAAGPAS